MQEALEDQAAYEAEELYWRHVLKNEKTEEDSV